MHRPPLLLILLVLGFGSSLLAVSSRGGESELPRAFITGADWTPLSWSDFVNVNGTDTTWSESAGVLRCSGDPLGAARSRRAYTNFELVLEWKHTTHAGNSGLFLWCPESAFIDLPPGQLPRAGIEVQILDLGYETNWKARRARARRGSRATATCSRSATPR